MPDLSRREHGGGKMSHQEDGDDDGGGGKRAEDGSHVLSDDEIRLGTAHDWEYYQNRKFFDDGNLSWFWQAHTLTTLALFVCWLLYEALSPMTEDSIENSKRGMGAIAFAFIVFGMIYTPDGPFKRPHPAFWRAMYCCSVLYELLLIYCLFQTPDDTRAALKHLDSRLGVPLEEKEYGGDCRIYDPTRPEDPYHNVWDKLDGFVPTHFFGWWFKTMILRDVWLCWVLSIMFEVSSKLVNRTEIKLFLPQILEYTLEHQLPNFSECWWDHWIMDALVCNGLGIYFGMKTLDFLRMKPYHWRGLWTIETVSGKLKRVIAQFSPYTWVQFDWRYTSSFKRWLFTLAMVFVFLLAELNTFYLKYILWIPPPNELNLVRLLFLLFWGAVSMREMFQYLDDPKTKVFGRQSWMQLCIIITETLICVKYDLDLVTKPLPRGIASLWALGILSLFSWTLWQFGIKYWRLRWKDRRNSQKRRVSVSSLPGSAPASDSSDEEDAEIVRTNGLGPIEIHEVVRRPASQRKKAL